MPNDREKFISDTEDLLTRGENILCPECGGTGERYGYTCGCKGSGKLAQNKKFLEGAWQVFRKRYAGKIIPR